MDPKTDKDEELTPEQIEAKAQESFSKGFKRVNDEDEIVVTTTSEPDAVIETADEIEEEEDEPDAKTDKEIAKEEKAQADHDKFMEKLPTRLRQIEGNVGGMMNKVEKALKDLTASAAKSGVDGPSKDDIKSAMDDPEAMEDLLEDYPKMKEVMNELRSLRDDVRTVKADRQKKDEKPAAVEGDTAGLKALDDAYSDWRTTVGSEDFQNWSLEDGPSLIEYNDICSQYKTDPTGADRVLSKWTREYPQWWVDRGARLFGEVNESIELLDAFKIRDDEDEDEVQEPTKEEKAQARAEAKRLKREKRLKNSLTPDGKAGDTAHDLTEQQSFKKGFDRVMKNSRVGNHLL